MDKVLLIKIVILGLFFFGFVVFTLVHTIALYLKVKRQENHKSVKRKLFKRKNSNVYDLKASRTKK